MDPALMQLLQSLLGVLFIYILVRWLFPTDEKLDAKRAQDNFVRCYPETALKDIFLSKDQKSAIILPASYLDGFGVVEIMGDKSVTKLFALEDVLGIGIEDHKFRFDFNDFTMPHMDLNLSEDDHSGLKNYLEASELTASKVKINAN
ncbi:hypothetical protein [Kordiimonas sp. SCSIO 12610]|uniref:hypothetical protein n=1 Tax=Kordiimonas sp. SCSIO 12610 TaxID=2829597 RepID=UPI00210D31CA|nr:hypothetical protein [Kordiimonas sp. SCSIO 12610]UTW53828.1 hypothetical protein KFF44_08200 [Kordiimonas sp. SCSIO 12610]